MKKYDVFENNVLPWVIGQINNHKQPINYAGYLAAPRINRDNKNKIQLTGQIGYELTDTFGR